MNIQRTCLVTFALLIMVSASLEAADDLQRPASWQNPTPEEIHDQMTVWLNDMPLTEEVRQQAMQFWSGHSDDATQAVLLEHAVRTMAVLEPTAKQIVSICLDDDQLIATDFSLDQPDLPLWIQRHLRLVYGRWLTNHRLYNEAHQQLNELHHDDVVDPATLLFYKSVVAHRLIDKDICLETTSLLLENETQIPQRYAEIARLMQADIQPLKQESLDEIARIMRNIHNRLDLGRAGKRVRTEEEEVLDKLKKMIEELEKEEASGAGGAGAGNVAPSNPANDSAPLGGTGPGDVDPKNIGHQSGWGNLPAKERQEALQQISKDFPSHYRNVIEEYFKKLARDVGTP